MNNLISLVFCVFLSGNLLLAQLPICDEATAFEVLDVNNVSAGLLNGGDLWWDLNNSKYEIPKGSDKHSLFSGALWVGGVDKNNELRVAGQTYRQSGSDFYPGPIFKNGSTTYDDCKRFDKIFHITQDEVEEMEKLTAQYLFMVGGEIPEYEIPENIKEWPAEGNPFFQDANGNKYEIMQPLAPFVDVDGQPGYDPSKGDYPEMQGDEMYWWVFNDIGSHHFETGGKSLGIEVHASAYAYSSFGSLNNTTFYKFKIHNKLRDLDSFRLGLFVDVDLGNNSDDFIGSDPTRDLAIGYNGKSVDEGPSGYGQDPPFIGIDFLNVETPNNNEQRLTNFMTYDNDFSVQGNPENARHYYNYLSSIWKDGSHLTRGGKGHNSGLPVDFIYDEEPIKKLGWSECQQGNDPFDQRMVLGSGSYKVKVGDVITLDFAAIWARCTEYMICPPFDCIQMASDQVQQYFDDNIKPTSIKDLDPETLEIYPNPSSGMIAIQTPDAGTHSYDIFNTSGQLIKSGMLASSQSFLDLRSLPEGFYFLSLDNGAIYRKIVLSRNDYN